VKVGPPAETIVETAHALPADLVVVGSTGKGAVKRLLLGSVADRVVHLSSVPVLVAR
jgi:nucleotide-binding universal stress UspA family protein